MFTFVLLGISIVAVWFPPILIGNRRQISPWLAFFVAAIISGLCEDYLGLPAIGSILILIGLAFMTVYDRPTRAQRIFFAWLTAFFALALAMHRLPGFKNPTLIENIKLSADAIPFTQYANFDKATVGLILLAYLCKRAKTTDEWRNVISKTLPIAGVVTAVVLGMAIALGTVRFEFKISSFTLTFLITNLLFTCVAEEAFFRGFFQERFSAFLQHTKYGEIVAILSSGILFGLVHMGGGMMFILLSTLAGIGNAYAYSRVRSIEAPIITHFLLNAIHFICFTYPQLQ